MQQMSLNLSLYSLDFIIYNQQEIFFCFGSIFCLKKLQAFFHFYIDDDFHARKKKSYLLKTFHLLGRKAKVDTIWLKIYKKFWNLVNLLKCFEKLIFWIILIKISYVIENYNQKVFDLYKNYFFFWGGV